MARRVTGIGRGNGEGSKRGQFKSGEPSANPLGRGARGRKTRPNTLEELVCSLLNEKIAVVENGVRRKQTQREAMLRVLLARFPSASVPEQLAVLRFLQALARSGVEEKPQALDRGRLEDFVAALAEEHRRDMKDNDRWIASGKPDLHPYGRLS